MNKECCDNCLHYCWYYDYCDKWQCEVDDRSVCSEYEVNIQRWIQTLYYQSIGLEQIEVMTEGDN